jgi:hypothetical protein
MNRRYFLQRAPLTAIGLRIALGAGTIGIALTQEGCNLFDDILNFVPVGEAAVNSVLSILSANGVVLPMGLQEIIKLVEAGFTALTAAVKEYQSTTPPPVGALAKIQAAFKDVVDNFSTFLASLNVSGGLLSIVAGIAQIIFSTIAAFVNRLPAPVGRTMTVSASYRVASATVIIIPKHRSVGQFKHDVDAVLAGAPAGVVVPPSAKL